MRPCLRPCARLPARLPLLPLHRTSRLSSTTLLSTSPSSSCQQPPPPRALLPGSRAGFSSLASSLESRQHDRQLRCPGHPAMRPLSSSLFLSIPTTTNALLPTTLVPGAQRRHNSTTATTKMPIERRAIEIEKRIAAIPLERYRNFCIVAHIDHGKSTLSDRLLEHTGTIVAGDGNKQVLDKLDVERERGITVKAQTCTMIYKHKEDGLDYLLHLVDTPGHVDFRAEVTRSYSSCTGALLLVDASQGVQAQTVANFFLAFAQGLSLVPVVNKIDMASADVPRVLDQLETVFELDTTTAVKVSAKTGQGVSEILPAVIKNMPPPVGDAKKPLRMLLVDSWYDTFKGVVLLVRLFDGTLKQGDKVYSYATGNEYVVGEVGIQYPDAVPQKVLRAGQVGYVFFNPGMKRIQDAKLGDTFTNVGYEDVVEPLPGFEEPKPMVFVAAFPTNQDDYGRLADSISHLVLNDRSVTLQKDYSEALGAGWRLGFLGSLHCSVFQDRLRQEHGANIIITEPAVPTKIVWSSGEEEIVTNPAEFPDPDDHRIRSATLYEPFVHATVTLPEEYVGRCIEICENARGVQKSLEFFTATQVILKYELPAASLVDDLFGKLKGATKGYATLDYEDAGWRQSQLVKLNLLVNKKAVDAVARIVHTSQVERLGRQWVTKFKEHVDRQMFGMFFFFSSFFSTFFSPRSARWTRC